MNVHSKLTNKKTNDGWNNVYRGLGGDRDVTTTSQHVTGSLKSFMRHELNSLYTTNWVAAKAVDIPIEDALKDDREFECEDADKLLTFTDTLEDMAIDNKIAKLSKWARVFGSAIMIFVTNDAEMDKPFYINQMKQGDLKNILVFDRWDVVSSQLDRDPLSPRYLKPDFYQLTKDSGKIHHSRVIQFDGEDTTNYNREILQGFGLSRYERLYDTIMRASMSPQLLINLLTQSNQDVFKIQGLNSNFEEGEDSLVLKRLKAIQQGKSIFNGIALDAEDDYTNIAKNFSGLAELNTEFYQVISGAADIPFSRFMGASISGLNPTGNGEIKTYYDSIISERKLYVNPYNYIDKVIQIHLFGEPLDYKWEFPSLFQMTDDEKSTINNRDAQTKEIYMRNGVIDEIEAKSSLVNNPMFPTITPEALEQEAREFNEMDEIEQEIEPTFEELAQEEIKKEEIADKENNKINDSNIKLSFIKTLKNKVGL